MKPRCGTVPPARSDNRPARAARRAAAAQERPDSQAPGRDAAARGPPDNRSVALRPRADVVPAQDNLARNRPELDNPARPDTPEAARPASARSDNRPAPAGNRAERPARPRAGHTRTGRCRSQQRRRDRPDPPGAPPASPDRPASDFPQRHFRRSATGPHTPREQTRQTRNQDDAALLHSVTFRKRRAENTLDPRTATTDANLVCLVNFFPRRARQPFFGVCSSSYGLFFVKAAASWLTRGFRRGDCPIVRAAVNAALSRQS